MATTWTACKVQGRCLISDSSRFKDRPCAAARQNQRCRSCGSPTTLSLALPGGEPNTFGLATKFLVDLQRFLACKKALLETHTYNNTIKQEMKTAVSIAKQCSARVGLLFRSNSRLRTARLLVRNTCMRVICQPTQTPRRSQRLLLHDGNPGAWLKCKDSQGLVHFQEVAWQVLVPLSRPPSRPLVEIT